MQSVLRDSARIYKLVRKTIPILTKVLYFGIAVFTLVRIYYHSSFFYIIHFSWFVFAYFLFIFMDKKRINPDFKLLALVLVWLAVLGRLYFYRNFFYYDKILHVLIPFAMTLIAFDFFEKNFQRTNKFVIFCFVLGLLASFEIFEYLVDVSGILGFPLQAVLDAEGDVVMSPIDDTMIDLILGAAGSFIALGLKKGKNTS